MSFAAGETSKSVSVTLNGDRTAEEDETFSLRLASPSAATVSDSVGVATIVNDDGYAYLSVNDLSVAEGHAGIRVVTFTITRSGSTDGPSSAEWSTADDTATSGHDYVAVPASTISFAAGETNKSASVTVKGDTADEANEAFSVLLSAPWGATVSDAAGVGTILDDD